ncbi:hypothetical protein HTIA_2194 [Halorhabdus tiamatea SARL4B]|uniref:Uncharacterized protein n=1 Tax=Halorhabdus tiamatea SARL4B TaxID=1033806 RepID=S6D8Z2_9EURY|nr:hypothetical protein HTIA_2194 [Halorhabdus tiamatea SARL4B]
MDRTLFEYTPFAVHHSRSVFHYDQRCETLVGSRGRAQQKHELYRH